MASKENWLQLHRKGFIDPEEYLKRGWIDEQTKVKAESLSALLNFRVPVAFKGMIDKGITGISRQFIPNLQELEMQDEEINDPIGDNCHEPVPGLTHRYRTRVLLKPTHQCATYCRFCFRREKVSHEGFELRGNALHQALEYIRQDPHINEVILSGGDPLVLTNKRLKAILDGLIQIPHLKTLRCHTRIPTVLPQRIDHELVKMLQELPIPLWLVLHVNCPEEFTPEAVESIASLTKAGIPLLHQGVLLKGVNDNRDTLIRLFQTMIQLKIKPYYLHYPDLAKGTNHFRIPLGRAIELVDSLRGDLPGYAVPQLMVDIPGGKGKIPLANPRAEQVGSQSWRFESPLSRKSHVIDYPDCQE